MKPSSAQGPRGPAAVTPLPNLRAALARRYPGVKVYEAEHRRALDGSEGLHVRFGGAIDALVAHGLAPSVPEGMSFDDRDGLEGRRFGSSGYGSNASVIHHSYDRPVAITRKIETQVSRALRRIARASRKRP